MLRTIVICPNRELSAELHRISAQFTSVSVIRLVDHYPSSAELTRMVRSHAPQLVLISAEVISQVVAVAAHLEQVSPGVQVIAAGKDYDADVLMVLMRAGVREFVSSPIDLTAFHECLDRVTENLTRRPVSVQSTELVYSFLPAKPGVGASSLAVNSTLRLSGEADTSALLCDFDLTCGIVRFLLKLNGSYSVLDAAEQAAKLDEGIWQQLVDRSGKLDVLHAGTLDPEAPVEQICIQHLVDYARRNYNVVCFDLSGNLERYSLELMHESRRIFLVCTTEVCSLHLAREKVQYLRRLDLGDRVSVLLNRHSRRGPIDVNQVESLVGAPVMMSFPNDYARLNKAIGEGKPVDSSSELGKQCAALAEYMADKKAATSPADARRRFVEYFTISPARFALESKKFGA